MSTDAQKRVPVRSSTGRRSPRAAITSSAFKDGIVEQATNLGDGYLIVKVSSSSPSRPSRDSGLPAIPEGQLRRVLARFTASRPAIEPPKPVAKRVARIMAEDNSVLLDELESAALARREALHEKGELLSSSQMCERLGISRQALSKAVRDRRMFWLGGTNGAQWYPSFFADGSLNRRDLEQVSVALGELPGATKWQFFISPKHSLKGLTPVDVLRQGALERVLRTAAEVTERNLGR